MSLDERLHAVIQALYDAAIDETLWPEALRKLTEITKSHGASFWVLDCSGEPKLPTFITVNFDLKFIEKYLADMAPLDPTVQYLIRHPDEPVVHDGLVITEKEKDRSAYYDWHERFSNTRFRMVGQALLGPKVQAGVALHRGRRAGRYEPDEIKQFTILHGHLQRALAIGFRLGSLGAMQQSATELLDRNPAAILLLDKDRRIVYANRAAERLCSAKGGIRLTADGLVLPRRQDRERLNLLIAHALAAPGTPLSPPGGVMRAHRESGKKPYAILVAPVSMNYPALSAVHPAVCIVITDPEGSRALPLHDLRAAFGLTEAEARLAAALASGAELRHAAAELNITYGTARVRLAEIFQKTDTRRQGELVRLLLTTLAPYSREE